MEPNVEPAREADSKVLAELKRYEYVKNGVVLVALLLLAASVVHPSPALAIARACAWAAAGVVTLLQSACAKRAGLPSNVTSAIVYFAVAVLPLLKGR